MSITSRFKVSRIEPRIAQEISIKNHYLHRRAPCMEAFGLIDSEQSDAIVGVVLYGVSASSTLLKGVCGPDEAKNVYELTRLWLSDDLPRNCESFLISASVKMVQREIVVSFADSTANHVGYVYQASNWLYTGLSTKFKDPKLRGSEHLHHTGWAHGMTNAQIIEKYGDQVYFVERPRKHRYVYFNLTRYKRPKDRAARKAELMSKLRYKILPYPKAAAS